jgi:Glycosyl transferase family 2
MRSANGDRQLVSIVMATHDRDALVGEAIESVLAQDYPNLELLVLDDGSTDDTSAVVDRYARAHPERVRRFRHPNMGEARTLNRGFELARGELVGRFCDDDRLLPGAVSRLAEALIDDTEAVLSYSGWHMIDAEGAKLSTVIPTEYSAVESIRLMDVIVGPFALWRREVTERVGGWDTELPHCADWEFCLRAASLGPFRRVPEPLFEWRQHPGRKGGQDRWGAEQARTFVELVDRAFSMPHLAPPLEEVEEEAYRNAHLMSAWAAGPGMNGPDERFYVADRHWSRNLDRAGRPEDLEGRVAELSAEASRLRDELARRDEQISLQDEHIRAIEASRDSLAEYLNRPWWRRLARRLTPAGDRTRARRPGGSEESA